MMQKDVCKRLIGKVVVTRYNNMLYRVKDIDFNLNPQSQFIQTVVDNETQKKKQVKRTYSEYLEERYYKTVTDRE